MKTKTHIIAITILLVIDVFFSTLKAQETFNTNNIVVPDILSALVSADFNEDGKMDIVKANTYSTYSTSDTIGIYIGTSTGILDSVIKIYVPIKATIITCADFNHDGHQDILLASPTVTDSIGILFGNGHCGFSPIHYIFKASVQNAINYNIDNIYATDLNNDGFPDLVVSVSANINNSAVTVVKILLNDTHGNFTLSPDITGGYYIYLVLTDLNNDGKVDLVTANSTIDKISVFLGNGDGTFGNEIVTTLPTNSYPLNIVSGDFNGDGKTDLMVENWNAANITPLFGNNDGTFNIQPIFASGKHASMITSADINGDGKMDIISTDYNVNSVSFFINNGNGTFVNDTNFYVSNPELIISADFNNDGKIDLAIGTGNGPSDATILILTNTSPLPAPKICIITEDTTHTYNVIAWEKTNMYLTNIDSFIVYREFGTNNYQRIGAVSKDSMSTFTDLTANPNSTGYRYKLKTKNAHDVSYFSDYHNTVWLSNNGATFNWTPYSVENSVTPVSIYNIYRDDNSTGNFQNIGFTSGNQFGYTDVNFSSFPNASYYVEAVLTTGDCHPTRSAFNGSTSNIIHHEVTTTINSYEKNVVSVYPNPATNVLNIIGISDKTIIYIYDVVGNLILEKETNINLILNIEQFSKGIYIVKVGTTINKIIIQ